MATYRTFNIGDIEHENKKWKLDNKWNIDKNAFWSYHSRCPRKHGKLDLIPGDWIYDLLTLSQVPPTLGVSHTYPAIDKSMVKHYKTHQVTSHNYQGNILICHIGASERERFPQLLFQTAEEHMETPPRCNPAVVNDPGTVSWETGHPKQMDLQWQTWEHLNDPLMTANQSSGETEK